MSGTAQQPAPLVTRQPGRAVVIGSWLVAVGVFAQALLAGQAWFLSPELFGLHGGIGHGVLLVALLLAIGCWVGRVGRTTALLATAVVPLLALQTGLGYSGRRSGIAAASALHVPLGAALLALTVCIAVLLTMQARQRP